MTEKLSRTRRPFVLLSHVLLCAFLGLFPVAFGQAPTDTESDQPAPVVSPKINAAYQDADVERWRKVFEGPRREVFERRFEILEAIPIRPGMVVADVGAGTGFYALLFAQAVGAQGKVYAVDISENFLADIERRAAENQLKNIKTILNDQRNTFLPPNSVDLVFICDTYHHFEYPMSMLASIHRALRDDGELVLIDFRRIPGVSRPWILSHVRAGQQQVTKELERAGFQLVDSIDLLQENYMLRFRKALGTDRSDVAQ